MEDLGRIAKCFLYNICWRILSNLNSTIEGDKGDEIDKFLNNIPIPYSFPEISLWSAVIATRSTKFKIWSVYVYTTCFKIKQLYEEIKRAYFATSCAQASWNTAIDHV